MNAPIPPITPYLVVSDARAAVEFYKKAFDAQQDGDIHVMPNTDKVMHVRLIINGSMVMLADDFSEMMHMKKETPEALGGTPVTLALQVADVQTLWDRAIAAGATVMMPLADQFWGDRYGALIDPFGHKWSMSQTLKKLSDEELKEAAEQAMNRRGTRRATSETTGDRGTTRPDTATP